MLASRGIASLALAYFKYEDLPKSFKTLELEYFEEAVKYLLSVPEVIGDKCGVIGTCLGGLMAILMGVYIKEVKSILTINTAAIAAGATVTLGGVPLNETIQLTTDSMTFDSKMRVKPVKEKWIEYLQTDNSRIIPVHKLDDDKNIIFVAGDNDSMFGHYSAKAFEKLMHDHNRSNMTSIIYEGAGHMIEPPYGILIEHAYEVSSNPKGKVPPNYIMYWGGTAKGQCAAQEHLWIVIQEYFKSNITKDNDWSLMNLRQYEKLTSKL